LNSCVTETAAVGIPNDVHGTIPFVYLVLKSSESVDEQRVQAELKTAFEKQIVTSDLPVEYLVT
jgi:acyl-coenzyme A synthetase/AMP-(fatty) acid ligase